jgi:hypothetical protein
MRGLVTCLITALSLQSKPTPDRVKAYSVYVDGTTLEVDQRLAVSCAEHDWLDHVPALRFTPALSCRGADICVTGTTELPVGILGLTSPQYGIVFLNSLVHLPGLLQTVTAHELGHAMGLRHADAGLMCRSYECASSTVADSDVGAWYAARGWVRPEEKR